MASRSCLRETWDRFPLSPQGLGMLVLQGEACGVLLRPQFCRVFIGKRPWLQFHRRLRPGAPVLPAARSVEDGHRSWTGLYSRNTDRSRANQVMTLALA